MGQTVTIGAGCMLSSQVVVRTSDGHGIFDATGEQLNLPAPVTVGDQVWLGNGVRVSKGCSIGSNAIVGQLSLAVGSLEPFGLYVGVPARRVRAGVTWSRTGRWEDAPEEFRPPAG
jgi:acetyltransferase-like isoleucine patch superfamily enzyme